MVGIVELIQLGVLTVHRQRVLGQVVGAHGEEGGFLCQLPCQHGGGRGLHHDADRHFTGGDALLLQLLADLGAQGLGGLQLPEGGHHGEHDGQVTVGGCPVDGTELGTEDLLPGQADPQTAQTQRRVLLLLQTHVGHLLVSTDVQRPDHHGAFAHDLGYLLISFVQLILGGQGVPAQIEEFASHEAHAFGIATDGGLGILGTADVGAQQYFFAGLGHALLATVGFQRGTALSGFGLLLLQDSQRVGVGVRVPCAGEAVHRQHRTGGGILKGDVGLDQAGDVQRTGQNGRMAGGRALTGDEGQDPVPGELDRFTGRQILGHQKEGALRELEAGIAAEDVVDPAGHITDVGGPGVHVLVVHGGEDLSEFLAGVQRRDRGGGTALDRHGNAVQIIEVIQHQQLDLHDGGLFLAQLHLGLLIQGGELGPGHFQSVIEFRLLQRGIAGGHGQDPFRLAVDHGGADRHAGEYGESDTSFHSALLTSPARSPHRRWSRLCRWSRRRWGIRRYCRSPRE